MSVKRTPDRYECALTNLRRQLESVGTLDALPPILRTAAIVHASHGVLMNGGLRYFYESDWPGNPPYALFVDAYEAVGAPVTAGAIRTSASQFPFPDPHLDQQRRDAFLESRFDGSSPRGEDFSTANRLVFQDANTVRRALREYIDLHATQFDFMPPPTHLPAEQRATFEDEFKISAWDRFAYHPVVALVGATYFAFSVYRDGWTLIRGTMLVVSSVALVLALFDYFTNHGFLRWVNRVRK